MLFNKIHATYLPNNAVKLIRGGNDYFEVLSRLIDDAKYVIHIQFYIFDDDETGWQVAEKLIEAANRNVSVYILVDGFASQSLSQELVEKLLAARIHFQRFEPLLKSKHFYFGRRLHHKVVVVDGTHALVSGLNISNRYNDMPEKGAWLDWGIYVHGDVANILNKICVKRIKAKIVKPPLEVKSTLLQHVEDKNCLVRVRQNDWVNRKNQIYNSYLEMFRNASQHIIIMSPYFLPGNEFRKNMRLAIKRGVRIQLILASVSDISLSKHAERFVYRWLLKNRIEIYEYQKNVLHGKIAVCDDEVVTIGSYNVNDLSAHASIELNIDVQNKHFAKGVAHQLTTIINEDCKCITIPVYKNDTNLFSRILQRFAYDFFRLVLFLFTFYFRRQE